MFAFTSLVMLGLGPLEAGFCFDSLRHVLSLTMTNGIVPSVITVLGCISYIWDDLHNNFIFFNLSQFLSHCDECNCPLTEESQV